MDMREARRMAEGHEAAMQIQKSRKTDGPIRLGQLLRRTSPSDLVRIKAAGAVIYSGISAHAPHIYDEEYVGRFGPVLDIFREDWAENGLKPPLDPGELPKYELKNINIRLYMVFELSV